MFDLSQFVLLWAIFLYPLVAVLALAGYFACGRLGRTSIWHFGIGGFFVGSVLGLAWFGQSGSPVAATIALGALVGVMGAATAATFWRLAVQEPAV